MIFDHISNSHLYESLSPRLAKALRLLRDGKLSGLTLGRHDIDGSDIYALAQAYQTKPIDPAKWEVHRKYIDVQFVEDGVERIGWAPLAGGLRTTEPYDAAKDIEFLTGTGDFVRVSKGMFAILFPQDAHMPSRMDGPEPTAVKKVVVKVAV